MQGFSVDRDRCIRDGLCVLACGRQALADDGEGGPVLRDVNACNACGHCSAICPVDAIVSPKCGGERAAAYPAAASFDFAGASTFLLSCRSMRRFKEEAVSEKDILDVLEVARKAPTASNSQPVSWLVLRGREKAQRFTALTMEWFASLLHTHPAMAAQYRVDNMLARYKGGYDTILRGAPCAVFALTSKDAVWGPVDGPIALTYFCLAAHGKNIGSCWCGYGMRAIENYAPLREFIGLDDTMTVQGMAFFGYPELDYQAIPPRKPLRLSWV